MLLLLPWYTLLVFSLSRLAFFCSLCYHSVRSWCRRVASTVKIQGNVSMHTSLNPKRRQSTSFLFLPHSLFLVLRHAFSRVVSSGKSAPAHTSLPPSISPLPSLPPSSPPLPFSFLCALYSRYEVSSVTGPIRWKRGGSQDTGDRLYTASSTASPTQPNATTAVDATTAVAGAAGAEEAAEQIPLYQVRHNSKPSMV